MPGLLIAQLAPPPPPSMEPAALARGAQRAAAAEWMMVVALIGVVMVVALMIAMRLARPRAGKPLRQPKRMPSAWVEAGRRINVDGAAREPGGTDE